MEECRPGMRTHCIRVSRELAGEAIAAAGRRLPVIGIRRALRRMMMTVFMFLAAGVSVVFVIIV